MFGRSFRIARVGGIPVNVDASWIYIAVLGVYWLYVQFDARLDVDSTAAFGYAVLGAILFFGSVFLHELAHAVTARMSGIHVEGITLVFFGGFTSARSEQKGAWRSFAISAMGPATTLVVAAVLLAAAAVVDGDTPLPRLLEIVGRINLFMAGFNALPGLPLESVPEAGRVGGSVLEQVHVLAAAPADLRPYIESSYYGESGVDVDLTSGVELRFGNDTQAARKWKAAAAVLADPSVTVLDYVALYAPSHPAIGGSGHALPPVP